MNLYISNNIVTHLSQIIPLAKLWIGASALLLASCVGPPALHESVLGYDQTTSELEQEILLLNIARLSQESSPHFTVTGSIAATFDFTTSANVGGNITSSPSTNDVDIKWSSSASEKPTFSIVPISGQDFTKRIIKPFPEGVFASLASQDFSIATIIRLMADAIRIENRNDGRLIGMMTNHANRHDEYMAFRRAAIHLDSLQHEHQLFVNNLIFDKVILESIKEPWNKNPKNLADAVNDGLRWRRNEDGTYSVFKRTLGRILISNYDPLSLTNDELYALDEIANRQPSNYVLVDIRPEHPGGEFPLFGTLKLRGFFRILMAVGQGAGSVQDELKLDITPDPRTRGKTRHNPRQTLTINVSDDAPPDDILHIQYKGKYYSIGDSHWDRNAFLILNALFQYTVTDVSDVGIPITIAK